MDPFFCQPRILLDAFDMLIRKKMIDWRKKNIQDKFQMICLNETTHLIGKMAEFNTCFFENEKIIPNLSTNYCFSTAKVSDCLKKFVET